MTNETPTTTIPMPGFENHFFVVADRTDHEGKFPVYLTGYSRKNKWAEWSYRRSMAKPVEGFPFDELERFDCHYLPDGVSYALSNFRSVPMHESDTFIQAPPAPEGVSENTEEPAPASTPDPEAPTRKAEPSAVRQEPKEEPPEAA